MNIRFQILLLCLLLVPPARALEHTSVQTHCGRIPEKFKQDLVVLKPWFGECEQRIRRAGYEEKKDSFRYVNLSCFFVPLKSGRISELQIYKTSGSEALDKECLNFILKASPFPKPTNELPYDQGVLVEFSGYPDVQVRLFSPRSTIVRRSLYKPVFK